MSTISKEYYWALYLLLTLRKRRVSGQPSPLSVFLVALYWQCALMILFMFHRHRQDLLAGILFEEQHGREVYKIVKELLLEPKNLIVEKPLRTRKVIISKFPSLVRGSEHQSRLLLEEKYPVHDKIIQVLAKAGPLISLLNSAMRQLVLINSSARGICICYK